MHVTEDFLELLSASPTAWHAAKEIGNRLAAQGFIPLDEGEKWELKPGHAYFVERGGAVTAFKIPENPFESATILASHTDSPVLKLKPKTVFYKNGMAFFRTETYGAPILHTWLDRDLAIAGRIIFKTHEGEIEESNLFLDHIPLTIPSLAIHLNRELKTKGPKLSIEEHICPLVGLSELPDNPHDLLPNLIGVQEILGSDLYLVPLEPPSLLGRFGEMIASYRLDNLVSVHASLAALLNAEKCPSLQMAIFWNHEEIGSNSDEGAKSPLLSDTLKRIAYSLNLDVESLLRLKNRSFCISCDNAHAYHPNYSKKQDAENAPLMGKGIAVKTESKLAYASSGRTVAAIVDLCQRKEIAYQHYAPHADIPCGSTVGSIMAGNMGIPTIDIGISQLAMHSIREIMATEDHLELCRLLKAALEEIG